jgi:hypothetical protein
VRVLVQLCEHDNLDVRAHAVKLFSCLAEGGDEATILEHVGAYLLWGLSTVSFFFLILNILCYTLFMETKTEEVANWFGHAKFTFAQLKLGGASQV